MKHLTDYHFFASSPATWATTTPDRSLPQLITMMRKEGMTFNLYMVPGPHDTNYEIRMYQPQVYGAEFLGVFFREGGEE